MKTGSSASAANAASHGARAEKAVAPDATDRPTLKTWLFTQTETGTTAPDMAADTKIEITTNGLTENRMPRSSRYALNIRIR